MNEVRISYIDKSFFIAVLFNLEKACASVLKSEFQKKIVKRF